MAHECMICIHRIDKREAVMADLKKLVHLGLRGRFVLLFIFVFCVFIGRNLFDALKSFDEVTYSEKKQLLWVTRWIESEQQRHFAQARQLAFSVMNAVRKGMSREECLHGISGESNWLDPEFGRFALAAPDGRLICNSIPWLTAAVIADEPYFKAALASPGSAITYDVDNHDKAKYAIVLSRAMRDGNGKVESAVMIPMDFSWVQEEFSKGVFRPGATLLVVNSKGIVMAGYPDSADWVGRDITQLSFYRRMSTSTLEEKMFRGLDSSGTKSIIILHQFRSGIGPVKVIVSVPESLILNDAHREFAATLTIDFVILLVVLFLAYYWTDKYFLHRIMQLERATKRLAEGRLSGAGSGVSPADDELGHLAESFDQMALAIQFKESVIEKANQDLGKVNRALRVLSAGNRTLVRAEMEKSLLDDICRVVVEVGDYLMAWVGYVEND